MPRGIRPLAASRRPNGKPLDSRRWPRASERARAPARLLLHIRPAAPELGAPSSDGRAGRIGGRPRANARYWLQTGANIISVKLDAHIPSNKTAIQQQQGQRQQWDTIVLLALSVRPCASLTLARPLARARSLADWLCWSAGANSVKWPSRFHFHFQLRVEVELEVELEPTTRPPLLAIDLRRKRPLGGWRGHVGKRFVSPRVGRQRLSRLHWRRAPLSGLWRPVPSDRRQGRQSDARPALPLNLRADPRGCPRRGHSRAAAAA